MTLRSPDSIDSDEEFVDKYNGDCVKTGVNPYPK